MSTSAPRREPLVVDSECVSLWDKLSERQRAHLEKLHAAAQAKNPALTETAADRCALEPATGKAIVIGILNPVVKRGAVLYEGSGPTRREDGIDWIQCSEAEMLSYLWRTIQGRQIVTFNGFSFDGPFLTGRSYIHGIKPLHRCASRWYDRDVHMDLREELSIWGKAKAYNLDFTCELLGIPSPKGELDGSKVGEWYRAGRIAEIAAYCLRDLWATTALWQHLAPCLPSWTK